MWQPWINSDHEIGNNNVALDDNIIDDIIMIEESDEEMQIDNNVLHDMENIENQPENSKKKKHLCLDVKIMVRTIYNKKLLEKYFLVYLIMFESGERYHYLINFEFVL